MQSASLRVLLLAQAVESSLSPDVLQGGRYPCVRHPAGHPDPTFMKQAG